jgi:hypothetical protein
MNGLMNSKKKKSLFAALTILIATLAGVSGCRTAQPILESVIVKDTVIVTETKYMLDTLEILKDTTIYQDKVRLQLKYIDRKVVVEAACLPDTIRVTQTKVLTKQEPKRKGWNFDQMIGALLFILVFAYLIKRWVDKLTE